LGYFPQADNHHQCQQQEADPLAFDASGKRVIPTESEFESGLLVLCVFSVIEKREAPKRQSRFAWQLQVVLDRQVKDAPLLIDNIFKTQIIDQCWR